MENRASLQDTAQVVPDTLLYPYSIKIHRLRIWRFHRTNKLQEWDRNTGVIYCAEGRVYVWVLLKEV